LVDLPLFKNLGLYFGESLEATPHFLLFKHFFNIEMFWANFCGRMRLRIRIIKITFSTTTIISAMMSTILTGIFQTFIFDM
jgi:hypothetical protein